MGTGRSRKKLTASGLSCTPGQLVSPAVSWSQPLLMPMSPRWTLKPQWPPSPPGPSPQAAFFSFPLLPQPTGLLGPCIPRLHSPAPTGPESLPMDSRLSCRLVSTVLSDCPPVILRPPQTTSSLRGGRCLARHWNADVYHATGLQVIGTKSRSR